MWDTGNNFLASFPVIFFLSSMILRFRNDNTCYHLCNTKMITCGIFQHMDLDLWLFKNKITKKEFARTLNISRGYLQHVLFGRSIASPQLAKKVYRSTGGKVKMKTRKEIDNWDK